MLMLILSIANLECSIQRDHVDAILQQVKSVAVPPAAGLSPPFTPGVWYFGGAKEYKANLGPSFNDMWNWYVGYTTHTCSTTAQFPPPFPLKWSLSESFGTFVLLSSIQSITLLIFEYFGIA